MISMAPLDAIRWTRDDCEEILGLVETTDSRTFTYRDHIILQTEASNCIVIANERCVGFLEVESCQTEDWVSSFPGIAKETLKIQRQIGHFQCNHLTVFDFALTSDELLNEVKGDSVPRSACSTTISSRESICFECSYTDDVCVLSGILFA